MEVLGGGTAGLACWCSVANWGIAANSSRAVQGAPDTFLVGLILPGRNWAGSISDACSAVDEIICDRSVTRDTISGCSARTNRG